MRTDVYIVNIKYNFVKVGINILHRLYFLNMFILSEGKHHPFGSLPVHLKRNCKNSTERQRKRSKNIKIKNSKILPVLKENDAIETAF